MTPVAAVLREIKQRHPRAEIRFWCDKKFSAQARSLISQVDESIPVSTISSGKLRRYHNIPVWRQLLRPFTIVLPNIRDGLLVGVGFLQSFVKLIIWRPDVVFTKGGYVCLPVGLAARALRIPLVIHDSDAYPGLTNRMLARHAAAIATGAPLKHYPYPATKTKYVGIPIDDQFAPFSETKRRELKTSLGFNPDAPLVVVTGGGLGATRINEAVATVLGDLLRSTSVLLISGNKQYDEMRALTPQNDERFQLHAFVSSGMASLLGAADIVVARAGATTILELAALAKPTILVPNGYLTGGHQLKNAEAYAEGGAVVVINEHDLDADPQVLTTTIRQLLGDSVIRDDMSRAFYGFAKPHAASDMADMILAAAKRS